jgi:hypothetical protein
MPGSTAARAATARDRALAALASQQGPQGDFPFFVLHPGGERPAHGLFSTVTVLLAAGPQLPLQCRERALDFVLACRRADGMWHYDPSLPIPADADDTACALAALARLRPSSCRRADAALLRSYWRPDGGPFKTWHSGEEMWSSRERDDAVVNANVLLALDALGAQPLEPERLAVAELVSRSAQRTRYYGSPWTVAYTALRAGVPAQSVPAAQRQRPARSHGCLALAQWLCTWEAGDSEALAMLMDAQRADGSWPAETWCTDNEQDWGCSAIVTALCTQALCLAAP